MWLNKLKIAIVEKNVDALDKLLDNIPEFSDSKDIKTTMYLLKEASEIFTSLRAEASASMKQIKANIKLLSATQSIPPYKLDIKS